jgi:Dyp-type peroxidase family
MKTATLESYDIQGIIISGYNHLKSWAYYFVEFKDRPQTQAWVRSVVDQITTADWEGPDGKPSTALNVAFTFPGLKFLGLPDASLYTFPQELREGMHEANRARRLGDAPDTWEYGNPDKPIHALLILQAENDSDRQKLEDRHVDALKKHGAIVVASISGSNATVPGEHFGFNDGLSQPVIDGAPGHAGTGTGDDVIKAGEFILGYSNEYDVLPSSPTVPQSCWPKSKLPPIDETAELDLGHNGSYLVVRQLRQNVAAFRKYIADQAGADPDDREWLAAKLVGRWRSGAPLVLTPNSDNKELLGRKDFRYAASDPNGFACPLGAHIRRANPRDSLPPDAAESIQTSRRHRLMRRGVPYGSVLPDGAKDDGKRGLLFICINADIQRQFEFVQQTWINNPKFNGLSNDPDPLLSSGPDESTFTIQGWPVRRRLNGLQQFVTMVGGAYFFLPSIRAMSMLGNCS